MSEHYLDRLMEHLEGAVADTYVGERKEKLLRRMLFGGEQVHPTIYNWAVSLYDAAHRQMDVGNTVDARTLIYHCARQMGLIQ